MIVVRHSLPAQPLEALGIGAAPPQLETKTRLVRGIRHFSMGASGVAKAAYVHLSAIEGLGQYSPRHQSSF